MNIIFDLGGVTLHWSSKLYLLHNFPDKEEYDLLIIIYLILLSGLNWIKEQSLSRMQLQ